MTKTDVSRFAGLGERVRAARLSLGLSQAQVAELCGLSVPYISRIETGKGNPTLAVLSALSEAISVPIVELVTGTDGREDAPAFRAEPAKAEAVQASGAGASGSEESSAGERLANHVHRRLRVGRDDLLGWARTEGAGLKLGELVRRLIRETTPDGTRIDFSSGVGALSGGWDGLVECDGAHPYVPIGRSGWELSTDRNAQRKAESDYNKRRTKVPEEERAAMVYVAVNCGPWIKAREFADKRSAEGEFREVRALNADDLVAWLGEAPEATTWLREETGQPVEGVEPLSQWWRRWLESTSSPLGDGVVLAGRREAADKLRRTCANGGIVTVGGGVHREEVLAFVAAALAGSENEDSEFGDALYVDVRDTARRLLASSASQAGSGSALSVVVESRDIAEGLSPRYPQCVVIPVPGSGDATVIVEGMDIAEASEALRAQSIEHDRAWELARLGRRSLLSLRRHLARQPELHRPNWADDGDPVLRRCLLVGCWDGSHSGDRAAVEGFCGLPYRDIEERLEKLSGDSEPPLVRVGARWHAVSQAGAFQAMGGRFQQAEFSDLTELAVEVIGEHDPLAGLHGVELVQAQYEGVAAAHSEYLKKGIAGSLAVLAESGELLPGTVAGIVVGAVARLLSSANSSPEPARWQALAQHLPALAEAAPAEFIRRVRSGMADETSSLAQALAERNDNLLEFSLGRFRLQLVAALDVLAWSSDYLLATADLLAELAEQDEEPEAGGQAAEALRGIMCPWMPNTSATLDTRIAVLDALHDRHSDAAWRTAVSMLPSPGSAKSDGHTPRFRTWKADRKPVTNGDYYDAVSRASTLMISWASSEPSRYADLISVCGRLLPPTRAVLLRELRGFAELADEPTRVALWQALRDMVVRHQRFHDAHWALPPAEIDDFKALMPLFQPLSASDQHRWLFQPDAWMLLEDLSPFDSNSRERDDALRERQAKAVADIHAEGGTKAVLEFASAVRAPRNVGTALARVSPPGCDAMMGEELANREPGTLEAARAYFTMRFRQDGWAPIDTQIAASSSPEVTAELLRASRDLEGAWERLDEMDEEIRDKYWQTLTENDVPYNEDLEIEVARRLGHAGRAGTAVNFLAYYSYHLAEDPEYARAATQLLAMLAEQGSGESIDLAHDSLTDLIEAINRHIDIVGEEEVARIEWLYLPLLGWGAKTPLLHKMLAQDPEFFAEVAKIAYSNEAESDTSSDDDEDEGSQRALAAYGLLHDWPVPPGLDETGQVDANRLRNWIAQARKCLSETDCSKMGDVSIGAALAAAPTNDQGIPDPVVCDVIEDIASEDMEAGYSTAVFNSLGVVGSSIGGGREKYSALEERYRAISRQLNHRWHRTASIYTQLADSYQYIANDRNSPYEDWQAGFGY